MEHGHGRGPEPRLQAAHQGGLLPDPADGPLHGPALRHGRRRCTRWASRPSCTTTRSASGGQGEIGVRFDTLLRHGRQADDVQVRAEERGMGRRQERHLHAEADLRGQRLGHAHPPVAVEGRRAALLRRGRLRGAVRPRPLVHRRPAPPRPRGDRVHQPDHQQLQAPGARLRGAGEPRLQPAQPLGGVPHPARAAQPQGEARRVPLPRLHVEPVPRVLGDDARRPRRHRQPHRAARRRWTRTSTTSRPRSWPRSRRCRARSSRPSTPSRPTTTSSASAASSPTTSSTPG